MSIKEKNVLIALMMGAIKENWYPPNIAENTTGDYYVFPHHLYEVQKSSGEWVSYKWYPNNVRQHGDYDLKFHSDSNWQMEAIDFIHKIGTSKMNVNGNTYKVTIQKDFCSIEERRNEEKFSIKIMANTKEAIFEALVSFSELIKL